VNRGDADPERAAANIMDTTPENQAPTFRNQNQVCPVRVIRRSDAVRPLPPHARSLADLTFKVGGVRLSLSDYMARRRTAGLLILKHGEIALSASEGIVLQKSQNAVRNNFPQTCARS
jgi:hypothetical protein